MTKNELNLRQWQRLDEVLPKLFGRMGYNDGGVFITANWDCKYIDARIDMRTGAVYLKPGNLLGEAATSNAIDLTHQP